MFGSSSGFEGDTFGILWSCSELREVHINKTGHKKPKLTFNLIDDKSYERVTVWDDAARACAINPLMAQEHPLVALKAVRITEYDNQETGLTEKELTVGDHSKIEIGLDIDIPCLNEVRAWWNMQTRQLETDVVDLTSP
ncbi:hypothetical protein FOL47_001010 [Perkinsus chesapeaki]|uniref:Replication protein A OB domain-containing protein n=1 Tax=Perkinsus chesapeaki TaxID=330153 RepID=A0A7J6KU66_PERCH|nr:hypothetical protein FOL47_001010 [Perkinsus chesapeaki]